MNRNARSRARPTRRLPTPSRRSDGASFSHDHLFSLHAQPFRISRRENRCSAPRADSLDVAERSFYSPERSSVRVCSRSGRIEHLTVWHVWSSGVARGARTHPEWTWLVGTYRRRASERKSRGCGECGCSSVLLIAILGHHTRAGVVGATININVILMRCSGHRGARAPRTRRR